MIGDWRPHTCDGCGQEIDPYWCWCGDPIDHSPWSGHSPVPMGCTCGYVRTEEDE